MLQHKIQEIETKAKSGDKLRLAKVINSLAFIIDEPEQAARQFLKINYLGNEQLHIFNRPVRRWGPFLNDAGPELDLQAFLIGSYMAALGVPQTGSPSLTELYSFLLNPPEQGTKKPREQLEQFLLRSYQIFEELSYHPKADKATLKKLKRTLEHFSRKNGFEERQAALFNLDKIRRVFKFYQTTYWNKEDVYFQKLYNTYVTERDKQQKLLKELDAPSKNKTKTADEINSDLEKSRALTNDTIALLYANYGKSKVKEFDEAFRRHGDLFTYLYQLDNEVKDNASVATINQQRRLYLKEWEPLYREFRKLREKNKLKKPVMPVALKEVGEKLAKIMEADKTLTEENAANRLSKDQKTTYESYQKQLKFYNAYKQADKKHKANTEHKRNSDKEEEEYILGVALSSVVQDNEEDRKTLSLAYRNLDSYFHYIKNKDKWDDYEAFGSKLRREPLLQVLLDYRYNKANPKASSEAESCEEWVRTYACLPFSNLTLEENKLRKERNNRRNNYSLIISFIIAIGEGLAAAAFMATWAGISAGLSVATFGFAAFVVNFFLFRADSFTALKDFRSLFRRLFVNDKGEPISAKQKFFVVLFALLSLGAGTAFGVISFNSATLMLAGMFGAGAAWPVVAAFIAGCSVVALSAVFYCYFVDWIRNEKYLKLWKEFKTNFIDIWSDKSVSKGDTARIFLTNFIFVGLGLFLGAIVLSAVYGLGIHHTESVLGGWGMAHGAANIVAQAIIYGVSSIVNGFFYVSNIFRVTNYLKFMTSYPSKWLKSIKDWWKGWSEDVTHNPFRAALTKFTVGIKSGLQVCLAGNAFAQGIGGGTNHDSIVMTQTLLNGVGVGGGLLAAQALATLAMSKASFAGNCAASMKASNVVTSLKVHKETAAKVANPSANSLEQKDTQPLLKHDEADSSSSEVKIPEEPPLTTFAKALQAVGATDIKNTKLTELESNRPAGVETLVTSPHLSSEDGIENKHASLASSPRSPCYACSSFSAFPDRGNKRASIELQKSIGQNSVYPADDSTLTISAAATA